MYSAWASGHRRRPESPTPTPTLRIPDSVRNSVGRWRLSRELIRHGRRDTEQLRLVLRALQLLFRLLADCDCAEADGCLSEQRLLRVVDSLRLAGGQREGLRQLLQQLWLFLWQLQPQQRRQRQRQLVSLSGLSDGLRRLDAGRLFDVRRRILGFASDLFAVVAGDSSDVSWQQVTRLLADWPQLRLRLVSVVSEAGQLTDADSFGQLGREAWLRAVYSALF